jgi:magnesium chelatase subunit I
VSEHPELSKAVGKLGVQDNPAGIASAVEFILEGLHLNRKLNKTEGFGPALYSGR